MPRIALVVLCLTLAVGISGCAAVLVGAAAAGTVQYLRNEAYRDYPATLEATWGAALQALRDHGYPVDPGVPYGRDGGTFEVNDVEVRVQATASGWTRVRVRVGTFTTQAHRQRAQSILGAIGRRLGV